MPTEVGFYSYGFAFLAYLFLTLLLLLSWRRELVSTLLVTAGTMSVIWSATAGMSELRGPLAWGLMPLADLLKFGAWSAFLSCVLDRRLAEEGGDSFRWRKASIVLMTAAFILIYLLPMANRFLAIPSWLKFELAFAVWSALAIYGLLLVEQLFRNATFEERSATKFLCLGLGGLFVYDFFMFANGLLFKQLDPLLFAARGLVNALAVPLMAIAMARNPQWHTSIHVSRQVVFHSATLMGAGIYLLIMAAAGYFIRFIGSEWGGILEITFFCGSAVLLFILLFSDTIRARMRVFLSKHFFSFKYDYRVECTRFTSTLSGSAPDVPRQVIQALATLVSSEGGVLWTRTDSSNLDLISTWSMPQTHAWQYEDSANLQTFFAETGWIIDLYEYQSRPAMYGNLSLPDWLLNIGEAWLLMPLINNEEIVGVLLLKQPDIKVELNWEDRDLLKVAGQQAAAHLAQYQAGLELVNARQFEAFNRLSAYVVHDLKNILAQQSLMLSNAEKHKSNPEFVDDMIGTIGNSVRRMTRLMEQMRSGIRGSNSVEVDLGQLLQQVVNRASERHPSPNLQIDASDVTVRADLEELETVFGHIVQNAQEATPRSGSISVMLSQNELQAVVTITDTGCGMDAQFLSKRLFTPFDSTKGLTGMGVGAFESRQFIRSLGGDIRVDSEPGQGSIFAVSIPCEHSNSGVPE